MPQSANFSSERAREKREQRRRGRREKNREKHIEKETKEKEKQKRFAEAFQQAMKQHRFDREPGEQSGPEGELTPIGIAERPRDRSGDKAAGDGGQIEHRRRRCVLALATPEPAGAPDREEQREGGAERGRS